MAGVKYLIDKIQFKRADAATWTTLNPTPLDGEPYFERDTYKLKVGNGVDDYTTLPYLTGAGGGGDLSAVDINTLAKLNALVLDATITDISYHTQNLAGTINTSPFTPTGDYHVATKKYVDDTVLSAGGYTDEQAQDAIGTTLLDTAEINFTYDDITPSISAVINNNSVSNSKLLNVSQNTIKGRILTGSGVVQDLTAADVRAIINVEDGATADLTAGEIKTLYESNADTNAFTDAQQTKLGFITITQGVNLDTLESNVASNNVKVSADGSVGTHSDITIGPPSASSSGTLRILADVDLDGTYTVTDWTPPTGAGGSANVKVDSTGNGLVGTQNASNKVFTVSQSVYTAGSLIVFLNGQALSSGNGLTETNPGTGSFTLGASVPAPESFNIVIAQYAY